MIKNKQLRNIALVGLFSFLGWMSAQAQTCCPSGNLIANGGFELNSGGSDPTDNVFFASFNNWTGGGGGFQLLILDQSISPLPNPPAMYSCAEGDYCFGGLQSNLSPVTLQQSVSVEAGKTYTLCFKYARGGKWDINQSQWIDVPQTGGWNVNITGAATLTQYFDGTNADMDLTRDPNAGQTNPSNWNNGSTTFTATSTGSAVITFETTLNGGSQNSGYFLFLLDDISACESTTPPCSTTNPPIEFCAGDEYTLALPVGTTGTIQWYNNGNPIAGATNDTLIVTAVGTYTAIVTDGTGCTAAGCCPVEVIAGTNCCTPPAAPTLTVVNNVCPSTTGTISASSCGTGFHAEYSTDNGTTWSATAPTYSTSAITVIARCVKDGDPTCFSANSAPVTTVPVFCCPTADCLPLNVIKIR